MIKCNVCEREFRTENGIKSHHCVPEVEVTIAVRIPNIHEPKDGTLTKRMTVGQLKQWEKFADEFNAANNPLQGVYFEIVGGN